VCFGRGAPTVHATRDLETIDSEIRLLLAIRHMVREAEGRPPSTAAVKVGHQQNADRTGDGIRRWFGELPAIAIGA